MLDICGEHLLVATRDARSTCPYIMQIDDDTAVFWKILEQNSKTEKILSYAEKAFQRDRKELFIPFMSFLGKMGKAGYVRAEDVT